MKLRSKVLGLVFFFLLTGLAIGYPVNKGVVVEFGYTPPTTPAVSGFNLYQEGVKVCSTDQQLATTMDCSIIVSKQTTIFTLTAKFVDGTESPHSAPYSYVYQEPIFDKTKLPIIINLQLY